MLDKPFTPTFLLLDKCGRKSKTTTGTRVPIQCTCSSSKNAGVLGFECTLHMRWSPGSYSASTNNPEQQIWPPTNTIQGALMMKHCHPNPLINSFLFQIEWSLSVQRYNLAGYMYTCVHVLNNSEIILFLEEPPVEQLRYLKSLPALHISVTHIPKAEKLRWIMKSLNFRIIPTKTKDLIRL